MRDSELRRSGGTVSRSDKCCRAGGAERHVEARGGTPTTGDSFRRLVRVEAPGEFRRARSHAFERRPKLASHRLIEFRAVLGDLVKRAPTASSKRTCSTCFVRARASSSRFARGALGAGSAPGVVSMVVSATSGAASACLPARSLSSARRAAQSRTWSARSTTPVPRGPRGRVPAPRADRQGPWRAPREEPPRCPLILGGSAALHVTASRPVFFWR